MVLLGPIPKKMIQASRLYNKYFTESSTGNILFLKQGVDKNTGKEVRSKIVMNYTCSSILYMSLYLYSLISPFCYCYCY